MIVKPKVCVYIYPIIDSETGARLHDSDLVECIREALAEHVGIDLPNVDYDELSDLEKIEAQLDCVSPMPQWLNKNLTSREQQEAIAKDNKLLRIRALKLLEECRRIEAPSA